MGEEVLLLAVRETERGSDREVDVQRVRKQEREIEGERERARERERQTRVAVGEEALLRGRRPSQQP